MSKRLPWKEHFVSATYEDLMLVGGSVWRTDCTCGWTSRPSSTPQVSHGLWRKHLFYSTA